MATNRAARRRRAREQARAERRAGRSAPQVPRRPADNYGGWRRALRTLAAERGEWAGIPVPLMGERLIIEPTYPYASLGTLPTGDDGRQDDDTDDLIAQGWKVRSTFWSVHRRSTISIIEKPDGSITWGLDPGVHHLDHDLRTLGCADAWGIEQETRAQELLASLVTPRAFKQYVMTGTFLETSRRSGVTYMFRRLKPTVALTPRRKAPNGEERMGILAALCLHAIGYYAGSWAGAMTPTDDVIAHLSLMRGDEHLFWRRANQIPAWMPNAGL